MSNLGPIEKIALYGAPDRVNDALQDVALERGLQVVVIVDDPTDIAARPGLAAKSGTPFDADSVARSVAGTDAVIMVLNSRSLHIGGFERTYDAIIALLEGLPTARVERLMLIGEHGWLDRYDGLPTEKLEHLQHSLHKSPLAWTLVDAPGREPNAFMTLQQYACSVIDQCLQGTSVKQRLHVDSRPQAEEAP
nr:NAD(P)H-binding protein [uncultured Pseudomonas sp.]